LNDYINGTPSDDVTFALDPRGTGDLNWYRGGVLFRTDFKTGGSQYFKNGKLHREDGPASDLIYVKSYWIDGVRHRLDGPASYTIGPDGISNERWFYRGIDIGCSSQEEFEGLLKLKAFW